MAYEALDSLRATLNRILNQSHHSDINEEIISIHDEAVFLQLNLANNPQSLKEGIRREANTTEEILKHLFPEDNSIYGGWKQHKELRKAGEKFKSTSYSINSKRRRLSDIFPSVRSSPSVSSSSRTATISKDVVVGFDVVLEEIKNWLTGNDPSQLQVFSIVGMGGTGKTTLAKLVYNDDLIVKEFDIRAWVTVSQDHSVGSILSNLLASLGVRIPVKIASPGSGDDEFLLKEIASLGVRIPVKIASPGSGDDEFLLKEIASLRVRIPVKRDDEHRDISMESLIRGYLNRRRYLVVIDDMCSKKAWDELKMLFPDTNSGSRIMLTTRLHDVASYVDSSCSNIHTMRLLDAHHSWNLLKKKVFAYESCPVELEDVGKKIVKICGGLPLSIVVVAGALSKFPKTRGFWKNIIAANDTPERIIYQSYNLLPDHLRVCLLYMAGFPEDYEIRVSELIKLWVAEGFLSPTGSKSMEEEGEDCLENLVERNLVVVTSRKLDGKIKSCSVHDIIREFCIKQGVGDKFFLPVVDFLPSPILRRHFLPRLLKNYRRISATSHDLDFKESVPNSFIRTIICIPQRGYKSVGSVERFSFLRVFHVLRINDNWEWEAGQVFSRIYLTYLAFRIPTPVVPPAISKLQCLQTLIIYRWEVVLPVEIWSLQQLRHLIAFSFSLPHPKEGATLPLEKLQTMSLVVEFACSGRMMKMIPNIKKLGIRCSMEVFDDSYHLDNLKHLCHLEKLKLESCTPISPLQSTIRRCRTSVFPQSLKKLTMCGSGLPWQATTIITCLPNLQVLKLRNHAYIGQRWMATNRDFGELRVLLIEGSNLSHWITAGNIFPKLECLILLDCPNLSGIPSEIGDIPTLKLIEVDTSLLESAKKIQDKQWQSGNDNFQVRTINVPDTLCQLQRDMSHAFQRMKQRVEGSLQNGALLDDVYI